MSNQKERRLQSLNESIEEVTREVERSPEWLETIYERNRLRADAADSPSGATDLDND